MVILSPSSLVLPVGLISRGPRGRGWIIGQVTDAGLSLRGLIAMAAVAAAVAPSGGDGKAAAQENPPPASISQADENPCAARLTTATRRRGLDAASHRVAKGDGYG